jgi:hypothetical protein
MTDKVPTHIPKVVFDKYNPPMVVGSIYPNIATFKLCLPTHAIINEFEYNNEKSELGRVRAYCSARIEGCKWRIHASTMGDNVTVKVMCTNLCLLYGPCSYFINNVNNSFFLVLGEEESFSS